jgi:hypothetical protein
MLSTTGLGRHPRPIDERRLMPYMLSMPAGEIGDPIALFILMKADDLLLHAVMPSGRQETLRIATVRIPDRRETRLA